MAVQQVVWLLLFWVLPLIADVKASGSATFMNESSSYRAERRLRQALMGQGEYDARERPVNVSNEPVQVHISLIMYALISLEEKEQTMTGASWLLMHWRDYRFHWNPDDYGDLRYISLRKDEIWTPQILLTNTASEKIENPVRDNVFRALVNWNGVITLEGPIMHKTTCPMDLSQFPFDNQTCDLDFAPQNMPSCIMNLNLLSAEFRDLSGIYSQWRNPTLTGNARSLEVKDPLTGENKIFSKITFHLSIRRLPNHYMLNVVLPSGILTFLSLAVFWLSPDSGERISMGVSLILGQAVFWLVVAESLPPTGSQGPPLLLDYIEVNFVVGGLAIVLSVITVSIHHRPGPLVNRTCRKLFLRTLPEIVCMRSCVRSGKVGHRQLSEQGRWATAVADGVKGVGPSGNDEAKMNKDGEVFVLSKKSEAEGNPNEYEANCSQNGSEDMKLVATALDRIFFITSAIIFAGGHVVLIAGFISSATDSNF